MGKGEGEGQGAGWGIVTDSDNRRYEKTHWKHGPFDCMSDISNCLCGCFCYPYLIYRSANKLEQSGCLCCILGCFLPCVTLTILRGTTRAKLGIPGNTCGDALCAWCCEPCVNCQIANELGV